MDILYRHNYRNVRMPSAMLQKNDILERLHMENLVWIRPVHHAWENTLRNPVVGCILDIRRYPDAGFVHVDTLAGRKLIRNVCFKK